MKKTSNRRLLWIVGSAVVFLIVFAGLGGAVAANNSNEQCFACHSNPSKHFVYQQEYQDSVHGALSCNACHGEINSFPHEGKANEAVQMCIGCHSDISREFINSVHGKLFAQGRAELGCASCHGPAHAIKPGSNSESPVTHLNVAETCSTCHEGEVVESYLHSFHGIANKFGSETTAQCVSCHGSHSILGPEDPASTVAKENVAASCAECHGKEALANFAEGPEHFSKEPGGPGAPMYWTLKFFTWLTIITISLLIVHIELELFGKLRQSDKGR